MPRVLLALGANLGDRAETLGQSLAALTCLPQTQLIARSAWHETLPVGGPAGQPGFLNGAVLLASSLSADDLGCELRQIESHLGRERHARWEARQIDLDLLLYGRQVIATAALTVPHPRMAFRRFVLDPACEIAGEMIHPPSGWTLAALRCHWQTLPRTVSVESADHELVGWLTAHLIEYLDSRAHNQPCPQAIELVEAGEQPALMIQLGECPPRGGPVIHIEAADRQVVLQEAQAAITAAWPD